MRLQSIANLLELNIGSMSNPSLLNGKMGLVLFFFKYARYSQSDYYEELAGEIIDEIITEISGTSLFNIPLGLHGLMGIGWGIEYLVQNNFIEADTDEVLKDIEKKIFGDKENIADLIRKGISLFDLIHYLMMRNKISKNSILVEEFNLLIQYVMKINTAEYKLININDIAAIAFLLYQNQQIENRIHLEGLIKMTKRIQNNKNNISNNVQLHLFHELVKKINIARDKKKIRYESGNEEELIIYYSNICFHSLLYTNLDKCYEDSSFKVKELILKDEFWNQLLIKLNMNNSDMKLLRIHLGMALLINES